MLRGFSSLKAEAYVGGLGTAKTQESHGAGVGREITVSGSQKTFGYRSCHVAYCPKGPTLTAVDVEGMF